MSPKTEPHPSAERREDNFWLVFWGVAVWFTLLLAFASIFVVPHFPMKWE